MIYLLCIMIAFSIIALDQFFKYWIIGNITLGGVRSLIPGIISLTHIENTGAAFSMLANMRWLLLTVTFIALSAIVVYMIKGKMTAFARIGLSMILGGAIGNAIDRIAHGYVVDMFNLDFMNYAIFNVADCFITTGGIIFCLYLIFDEFLQNRKKKKAALEALSESEAYKDSDDEYDEYDEYDDSDEANGTNAGNAGSVNGNDKTRYDDFDPIVNYQITPDFKFDKETLAIFDENYNDKTKKYNPKKTQTQPTDSSTDTIIVNTPADRPSSHTHEIEELGETRVITPESDGKMKNGGANGD